MVINAPDRLGNFTLQELTSLQCKKQGHISWEEYRDAAQLCRDDVRKAKAQLELNVSRDAKNSK